MLKMYLILVVTLGCYVLGGVIQSSDDDNGEDKFEEFLQDRCLRNADVFDMEEHADKLKVKKLCLRASHIFSDVSDDEDEIEAQCQEWSAKADKCFNATLAVVEPCFKEEERYIPQFARQSYKAYLAYFCENPKIFTVSELLETNMAKCFNRFLKHPETDPQHSCFSSIFDASPLTKRQLCRDLTTVYSCFERHYKQHCADSPEAWAFESGLLYALRSPCNSLNQR